MRTIYRSALLTATGVMLICAQSAHAADCAISPGQLRIESVVGAGPEKDNKFAVLRREEITSITIKGAGEYPCPDKCKCGDQTLEKEKSGKKTFAFEKDAGTQTPPGGDTIKWAIRKSTKPGKYKFQLAGVTQKFKTCPKGWTGDAETKINALGSEEKAIIIPDITFQQSRGTKQPPLGGAPGWWTWGQPGFSGIPSQPDWAEGSFSKTMLSATSFIKIINHAGSPGGSCNTVGGSIPPGYSEAGVIIVNIQIPDDIKLKFDIRLSLIFDRTSKGAGTVLLFKEEGTTGRVSIGRPEGYPGIQNYNETMPVEIKSGTILVYPSIALSSPDAGYFQARMKIEILNVEIAE